MGGGKVFTAGVFDLFHVGHLRFLRKCATFGETLCVGIMTDSWVKEHKNRDAVIKQHDRLEIVKSLRCVSQVSFMDETNPAPLMHALGASIFVHGDDWIENNCVKDKITDAGLKYFREHNIVSIFPSYTEGVSTTQIIRKIIDG